MHLKHFIMYTCGLTTMLGIIFVGFSYQHEQFSFPTNTQYASIKDVFETPTPSTNHSLTRKQKIEQLFMVGFEGTTPTDAQNLLQQHAVGGVILLEKNILDPTQVQKLTQQLQTTSIQQTGLPILIGIDQEGGDISRIHFDGYEKTPQSEIKDVDQAYAVAKKRGEELYNLGINMNFSPVLDVIADTQSFLSTRAFQKTIPEISSWGAAMVRGYADAHIHSCPKHFPGHGGALSDPHISESINTESRDVVWDKAQSFLGVIAEQVGCIMVGHTLYTNIDQDPGSRSSIIMNRWLRSTLQFKGVILTDDMEMTAARLTQREAMQAQNLSRPERADQQTLGEASLAALQSGADMILISGYTTTPQEREEAFTYITKQIENGALSEKQIDEKISRITKIKHTE